MVKYADNLSLTSVVFNLFNAVIFFYISSQKNIPLVFLHAETEVSKDD